MHLIQEIEEIPPCKSPPGDDVADRDVPPTPTVVVEEPNLATKAGRDRHYPKPKRGRAPDTYPVEFDAWWQAYPSHPNAGPKAAAYHQWRDLVVDGEATPDDLEAAARRYAATKAARAGYVRRASAWLGQGGDWMAHLTDTDTAPTRRSNDTRETDADPYDLRPVDLSTDDGADALDRLFGAGGAR